MIGTDIKFYGSASMQEDDDDSPVGGAISVGVKVVFTDIVSTDEVTIISDNAGDTTQVVTIYGRNSSGQIIEEDLSLNGTTRVVGTENFQRILKVVTTSHTGTITITRNNGPTYTQIAVMESGVDILRRLFYNAEAEPSGGSSKYLYEKVFVKNTNGTDTLNSAVIKENTDPSGLITFDLEDTKGGSNSTTDRITAPSSGMLSVFNNDDKSVPEDVLGPNEYIGVWLKMTLAAGQSPAKNFYRMRVSGAGA